MKGLDEYLLPYLLSQVASILILLVSLWRTKWGRLLLSALFLWASVTNLYIGLRSPDSYLDNARLAIPLYRDFINGWFSHYHHIIIPMIGAGQLLIGIGMLLKDWWVKWACIGSIIFLISIAPLMVGSAFPFSITVSIAAFWILKKDDRKYIFRKIITST